MTRPRFNPNDHMMKLQKKDYLPVAPRLAWVNDDQESGNLPTGTNGRVSITTELVEYGRFEENDKAGKPRNGWQAVVRAHVIIRDPDGNIVKEGKAHKRQTNIDFADFLEKAETGAIGRALASIGYGTIQSLDFEEGEKPSPIDGVVGPALVDTPYAAVTPSAPVAAPTPSAPVTTTTKRTASSKVTVTPALDPLAVLTGKPAAVSVSTAEKTPPPSTREERLEWIRNHLKDPQVAQLLNETLAKAKVKTVRDLPDEHLQAAYEAARAFSSN